MDNGPALHSGRICRLFHPLRKPNEQRDLRRRHLTPLGIHLPAARRNRAQTPDTDIRSAQLSYSGTDTCMGLRQKARQGSPRILLRTLPHRLLRNALPDRIHQGTAGRLRRDYGIEYGSVAVDTVHHRGNLPARPVLRRQNTGSNPASREIIMQFHQSRADAGKHFLSPTARTPLEIPLHSPWSIESRPRLSPGSGRHTLVLFRQIIARGNVPWNALEWRLARQMNCTNAQHRPQKATGGRMQCFRQIIARGNVPWRYPQRGCRRSMETNWVHRATYIFLNH